MIFLTFFIIPLIVGTIAWIITKKITWKEAAVQLLVQVVFVGSMVGIMLSSNMSDSEIWNGSIIKKKRQQVPCRHSYQCHCVTHYRTVRSCSGSGKSRRCSSHRESYKTCQTCYEHIFDVDWVIYNNIGERWSIARVDRQGIKEPPRYTTAKIGEPTSSAHSYKNYIKGSPDSLFKTGFNNQLYQKKLPPYPSNIYDYHRLNRLVTVGISLKDKDVWNKNISKISSELGPSKQVNIIVVLTNLPQDYFQSLRRHWLGGKKNDAIAVIGVNPANKEIRWVEVMSLSNEEFKVRLRNGLMTTGKIEPNLTIDTIRKVVATHFKRKPMKDFEYLKASVQPSMKQWIWGMICSFLLSIGLSLFFFYQDPFN